MMSNSDMISDIISLVIAVVGLLKYVFLSQVIGVIIGALLSNAAEQRMYKKRLTCEDDRRVRNVYYKLIESASNLLSINSERSRDAQPDLEQLRARLEEELTRLKRFVLTAPLIDKDKVRRDVCNKLKGDCVVLVNILIKHPNLQEYPGVEQCHSDSLKGIEESIESIVRTLCD